uniref:TLDc domain-containing protein n=1 Tax=Daucus carota subsp. sativus TaxID=79200 RepID=A0A175YQ23_DAUCS
MPKLTDESLFLYAELYGFLQLALPNIVKGCEWGSTVKHGISLRTLIRKSGDLPGPCLLITGDMQGAIFGGLFESPLAPTAKQKYQGTNQTFVFTTIDGGPRLFRPKGANRYFYLCLNDLLAFGGGGNFALRLDGDLLNFNFVARRLSGTSGPCDTFENQCLAHNQEFELKNVELWGFTHSSQYTN